MPIVINSQFNPISFEDRIKPFEKYREYYKENKDELKNLSDQLSELIATGQIDPNSDTMKAYKSYQDNLNKVTDAITSGGMNSELRDLVTKMSLEYPSKIKPIAGAIQKRQKEQERQAHISDSTGGQTIFSRDAFNTSIDDYMRSDLSDFKQVNLNMLSKDMETAITKVISNYQNDPELSEIDKYHNLLKFNQGVPASELYKILDENNTEYADIREAFNKVLDKYHFNSDDFKDNKQTIFDTAVSSLASSLVQQSSQQVLNNPAATHRLTKAEQDRQERLMEIQIAAQVADGDYDNVNRYRKQSGTTYAFDKLNQIYIDMKTGEEVQESVVKAKQKIVEGAGKDPTVTTSFNKPVNTNTIDLKDPHSIYSTDEDGNEDIDSAKVRQLRSYTDQQSMGFKVSNKGTMANTENGVTNDYLDIDTKVKKYYSDEGMELANAIRTLVIDSANNRIPLTKKQLKEIKKSFKEKLKGKIDEESVKNLVDILYEMYMMEDFDPDYIDIVEYGNSDNNHEYRFLYQ